MKSKVSGFNCILACAQCEHRVKDAVKALDLKEQIPKRKT